MNVLKRMFKTKVTRSIGGNIVLMLFMLLMGAFMALPLIYAVCNALKPANELWIFPPRFFVRHPTLENFGSLLSVMGDSVIPFSRYIFNTVFTVVASTVLYILFASMCAYPLAKYRFPFSKTYYAVIVTALMFSSAVMQIPNYLILSGLGAIDTYLAIILPAAKPLGLFLMKQFMEQNIPDSLLESAEIDGAGEWVKYSRIVMPLVRPAWLTLMILSVQDLWSAQTSTFIYSEELKPLTFALTQLSQGGVARYGVAAAVQVVILAVPLLIFTFCQSRIIETMSTSGIKD